MKNVGNAKAGALENLPAGYMPMRVESGLHLIMPAALARRREAQIRQREQREVEAKHAEILRADIERKGKAVANERDKAPSSKSTGYDEEPLPGWYRVLPAFEAIFGEKDSAEISVRVADKDVQERHAKLWTQLQNGGPDRRVAQPENWRAAITALKAELPNFAEPIAVLSNTLALAEATQCAVRIPPMLLLGPAGLGKTYFSHRVANMLGVTHAQISFDSQPPVPNSEVLINTGEILKAAFYSTLSVWANMPTP